LQGQVTGGARFHTVYGTTRPWPLFNPKSQSKFQYYLAPGCKASYLTDISFLPEAMVKRAFSILTMLAVFAIGSPAGAVMVFNNPSGNTDGTGVGGWQYVGSFASAGGVAIAPHHFLATQHQAGSVGGVFNLNGTAYLTVGYTDIPDTDLRLWQVAGTLNAYTELYRTSAVGQPTNIIGQGIHTLGSEVDVIPGPGSNGWRWGATSGKSWGVNTIDSAVIAANGYRLIQFDFDPAAGEATYGAGDSGGGVFVNDNGTWKLAGLSYAVESQYSTTNTGTPETNPDAFRGAVYDGSGLYLWTGSAWIDAPSRPQHGYAHDLSHYASAIDAAIPEPATLSLLATATLLLLRRRR
jgi:hypothetical protein